MYDKPLSYSGLSLYKQCPARWAEQYINGNREPSGPAAQRGTMLHEQLEAFFKGGQWPIEPGALMPWYGLMRSLRHHSPVPEQALAVTAGWNPVGFDDPNAYFRGKIDLSYTDDGVPVIVDFKSGRVYDSHEDQGMAYVALSPDADEYRVRFIYLDNYPTIREWVISGAARVEYVAKLREQIEEVRSAEEYPPTPGDHCRWCALSWRRGGTCTRAD